MSAPALLLSEPSSTPDENRQPSPHQLPGLFVEATWQSCIAEPQLAPRAEQRAEPVQQIAKPLRIRFDSAIQPEACDTRLPLIFTSRTRRSNRRRQGASCRSNKSFFQLSLVAFSDLYRSLIGSVRDHRFDQFWICVWAHLYDPEVVFIGF